MSADISLSITGDTGDKAAKKIRKIQPAIIRGIVVGLNRESKDLHSHIVKQHLSGAGEDAEANRKNHKLRRRTGEFVRKTRYENAEAMGGGRYRAGVAFDAQYSTTHVGEKGKVTTITPKNKKWLTIPLPRALTRAGVLRKPTKDYDDLFFYWPDKSKSPVLAKTIGKGKRAKIQAFFVLVKMVKIRTRIHPKEILRLNKNKIQAGLRRAVIESLQNRGLV